MKKDLKSLAILVNSSLDYEFLDNYNSTSAYLDDNKLFISSAYSCKSDFAYDIISVCDCSFWIMYSLV